MTTTPTLKSLANAVASVRARHHSMIAAALKWSLERGTPLDPDLLALVCGSVEGPFPKPGRTLTSWTRPQVNRLLTCDICNWCSFERCLIPEGVPETMWKFLDFLHDTGRLDPASDPLDNLREPLICYGGLGYDGRPRPPDSKQPFPCQCYLEVAPPSKPGLSRWRTSMGAVIELWRPAPAEPELVSWWMPLVKASREARRQRLHWPIYPDDFHFVGSIQRSGMPTIWVYLHRSSQGEFYVDEEGATYRLRADRRAKIGARFENCDLCRALFAAGLPHVVEPVWYDEPPSSCDPGLGGGLSLVATEYAE